MDRWSPAAVPLEPASHYFISGVEGQLYFLTALPVVISVYLDPEKQGVSGFPADR